MNSEGGVGWVGGRPIARRDPDDREGTEQLEDAAWAEVRQAMRRVQSSHRDVKCTKRRLIIRRTPRAKMALANLTRN